MGENAARRYFLTAERFTAAEALRIGFVHEVVQTEALDATVAAMIKSLVANSPNAVQQAKLLVRDMAGRAIDTELLTDSARRIAAIRASEEGREGVASFLEKRKPSWLAQP
jgi:methylglutaconyl-CoA hydratase